mgnify:CR=1 FL=1
MNTSTTRTILVIEDERPLLKVIQEKLEKHGARVITSRNVERAFSTELETSPDGNISLSSVERALNHLDELGKVDAVWLDHNLLGSENGVDFVTRLKSNGGHWSRIPVFVVSNTADPAVVHAYTALGVHNYYVKAEHKLENIVKDMETALESAK